MNSCQIEITKVNVFIRNTLKPFAQVFRLRITGDKY